MASIPCPRHSKRKRIGPSEYRTYTLEPRCATLYPLRYFFEDKGVKSRFIKNPPTQTIDSPTLHDLQHRPRSPRYLPPNIVTKVKCLKGPSMDTLAGWPSNCSRLARFVFKLWARGVAVHHPGRPVTTSLADKTPACKCRFSRFPAFVSAVIVARQCSR